MTQQSVGNLVSSCISVKHIHPLLMKADRKGSEWVNRIKMQTKLLHKQVKYLNYTLGRRSRSSDDEIVTTKEDSSMEIMTSSSSCSSSSSLTDSSQIQGQTSQLSGSDDVNS